MTRIGAFVLAAALAIGACGPADATAAGFIIEVNSTSITQVDSFTLRTPEGVRLQFSVGRLELEGGAFPAGHLREHMTLGQPVAVAYRQEGGTRVAYRLVDATWLQP